MVANIDLLECLEAIYRLTTEDIQKSHSFTGPSLHKVPLCREIQVQGKFNKVLKIAT